MKKRLLMMKLSISPVSFTGANKPKVTEEQKEGIRDGMVAGGAAGAGYTAVKRNTLTMLQETEKACKAGKAAAAGRMAQTAKNTSGLFGGLKNNAQVLTKRLVSKLDSIKTSKYIKPIINNKLTRFGCAVFGGALAVCILISGLGTLYNNASKIAENYIPRAADRINRFADRFEKSENE